MISVRDKRYEFSFFPLHVYIYFTQHRPLDFTSPVYVPLPWVKITALGSVFLPLVSADLGYHNILCCVGTQIL